jgi:hypothetical protein
MPVLVGCEMEGYPMDERRKYPRILTMYDVVELSFPELSVRICANAINLSYGGLGLYALERLPVGKQVTVKLGFWDVRGILHFETVDGVVRWCRSKGPGYAAGIRFDGLTPEKQRRIIALLEETDRAVQVGQPPALPSNRLAGDMPFP